MKTGGVEVIKPMARTKPLTRLNCSGMERIAVITGDDLQLTKRSLRSVNIQKSFENLFFKS